MQAGAHEPHTLCKVIPRAEQYYCLVGNFCEVNFSIENTEHIAARSQEQQSTYFERRGSLLPLLPALFQYD